MLSTSPLPRIVFLPFEASGVMGSIAAMKELFDPAAPRPVPKPPPSLPK
jgi:hypothetical protein